METLSEIQMRSVLGDPKVTSWKDLVGRRKDKSREAEREGSLVEKQGLLHESKARKSPATLGPG